MAVGEVVMAIEVILLAVVLVLLLAVLALLLRRQPGDPGIALLQAAQERQGERLGALTGELRAVQTEAQAAQSREAAALMAELTRLHRAAADTQAEGLGQARLALTEAMSRLTTDVMAVQASAAQAQQKGFAEAREAQADAAATLRRDMAAGLGEMKEAFGALRLSVAEAQTRAAEAMETRLKEMREANDARLADIQKSVNEQLAEAVEKKMAESFSRVIDQFTAVQKAMGDVQAVTAQIGDIKRLFGNVKTRGGWGETQVRALLDDILPPGSYEVNVRLREGSLDSVEFCVVMPGQADQRVLLPIDAKFPVEDYERLLAAWDAADAVAEAAARRGLEARIRGEARKIAEKYICPPATTEFAVLYLPTEGLYAEVARIPGLIDGIGRECRVVVLGPSLFPALLRTIQLGHVTLALSKNAEAVKDLLAATKAEMGKMDDVLGALKKQAGTFGNTIERAQQRTRAINRKLRGVEVMEASAAAALIGPDEAEDEPE